MLKWSVLTENGSIEVSPEIEDVLWVSPTPDETAQLTLSPRTKGINGGFAR
jgi:hypothetical protein